VAPVLLSSVDVFGPARRPARVGWKRGALAAGLIVALARCGSEQAAPDAVPTAWLDGEWWVAVTVVARPPPTDPGPLPGSGGRGDAGAPDAPWPADALAGAASPLHRVRFVLDGDTVAVRTAAGRTLARLEARSAGGRVAIDWGSNEHPVRLGPGWAATPERGRSRPFFESADPRGHRVGPRYIEWTVEATVDLGEAMTEALGRRAVEGALLRYSAVPAEGPDFARHPASPDRFAFRYDGFVPRLDFFPGQADRAWSERRLRPIVVEAEPGMDPDAFEALEEAVRSVSREIEAALDQRSVARAGHPPLALVRSRCNLMALADLVEDHPEVAEAIQEALCPRDQPLCVLDRARPPRAALELACRQADAATWDRETGSSMFTWARQGDLRFHRAGRLPKRSPFRIAASTAVSPEGRILRLGLRIDGASVREQAAEVAHWTERLLSPASDPDSDSGSEPGPEELLDALEWASRGLQRALPQRANGAFVARLRERAERPAPPARAAQLARVETASRAAGTVWSDLRTADIAATFDGRASTAAARATLDRAGLLTDATGSLGTLGLAVRFGTAGPEEAERRVRTLLERHRWLVALLVGLGLAPNPAASADPVNLDPTHELSASVTDLLPLPLRTELVDLGPADRAALRFAYAEQVLRFDHPVPPPDQIEAFVADHGPVGLFELLCRPASCPDAAAALARFEERSFGPLSASSEARDREVPFARCPLETAYAERDPRCRFRDWGLLPNHAVALDVALFRSEAWLHDRSEAWERLLTSARTARRLLRRASSSEAALETPVARSAATAVALALNAVAEVALRPPAGFYCRVLDAPADLAPCPPGRAPDLVVRRSFGRWPDSAHAVSTALRWLALGDPRGLETTGAEPSALFAPNLRQIAAVAVGRAPGLEPRWCPDAFGRLDRGVPSMPGVLDPVTGGPDPVGFCRDGLRLALEADAEPRPVDPAFVLSVLFGAGVDPTLGAHVPPEDGDCAVAFGERRYGGATSDDPQLDLACHALRAWSKIGDVDAAEALVRTTSVLAE